MKITKLPEHPLYHLQVFVTEDGYAVVCDRPKFCFVGWGLTDLLTKAGNAISFVESRSNE